MAISNYPSGGFTYMTNTYNSGRFRRPNGAWCNDTAALTANDPILDRSETGNDIDSAGGLTASAYADSGIYGVATDLVGGVLTATVNSDVHVIGWEDVGDGVYTFRTSLDQFASATLVGNTLTIGGDGVKHWLVRVNTRCFTPLELIEIAQAEQLMQETGAASAAGGLPFPEAKYAALTFLTGDTSRKPMPQLEMIYLEGLGHTGYALPDLWAAEYATEGFTTGGLPARAYDYLGAKGFTQETLTDRWYAFWLAHNI